MIRHAGSSCKRDLVDLRVINNVKKRNFGNYLHSQEKVGGWPKLNTYNLVTDTDRDGMPDTWERTKGLDPNNPSDRNTDRDGDGYTNLEEYLNELCRQVSSKANPIKQ